MSFLAANLDDCLHLNAEIAPRVPKVSKLGIEFGSGTLTKVMTLVQQVQADAIKLQVDATKVQGNAIKLQGNAIKVQGNAIKLQANAIKVQANTTKMQAYAPK